MAAATRPVAIKVDADIKERAKRLATARHRTMHWLMREAITQYVEREAFRQDAIKAWEEYRLTESHATAEEAAVKAIRESVKVLAHQPGIGLPTEDMEPEYREWIIEFGDSGYVDPLHYDGETAVVLAVRHQKEAGY